MAGSEENAVGVGGDGRAVGRDWVSFAGMSQTWVRPVPGSVALCDMSSGIWGDFLFAIVYLAHRPGDRRLWWGCGGRADSRRDADLVSGIQVSRDELHRALITGSMALQTV